jgi:hypothetical protein
MLNGRMKVRISVSPRPIETKIKLIAAQGGLIGASS